MTIAVTTHGGEAITTPNALFPNASESEDRNGTCGFLENGYCRGVVEKLWDSVFEKHPFEF